MKRLGAKVEDLKRAFSKVGEYAVRATRIEVPVLTGALKETVRQSRRQNSVYVYVGNNKAVPYAAVIHWGWPERNIRANEYGTRAVQKVDPFMRDALEE